MSMLKNSIDKAINHGSHLIPLYNYFKVDNIHDLLTKANDKYYPYTRRFNIFH